MMNDERQRLIALYTRAPEDLAVALDRFPREMWAFKPAHDKWSVHEIIVHLADSEANSYVRCRALVAEPGKTIMVYDQDRWALELGYAEQSTTDALELFRLLRRTTAVLLETMPASAWEHTIHHPENGMMTLDDWLVIYAAHVPGHIAQMERNLHEWRAGLTENVVAEGE